MKNPKTLFRFITILPIIFLASACSLIPTSTALPPETNALLVEPKQNNPAPLPTATTSPIDIGPEILSIDTTTVSQQGRIDFPYKTADAGNFMLQPGENIAFTWLDFPPGAAFYTIAVKPDQETPLVILGTDYDSSDGIKIDWQVQEKFSGSVVGFASFADGTVIGAEWSGSIYTGSLPPDHYCAAILFSTGVLDVFLEPNQDSPIIAHMRPGTYTQVYSITNDQWVSIDLRNHDYTSDEYISNIGGYVLIQDSLELYGPCDSIPRY